MNNEYIILTLTLLLLSFKSLLLLLRLLLLLLMLLEAEITALTIDVTKARKPIELIDCEGRHCLPPFSGMNTRGASLALKSSKHFLKGPLVILSINRYALTLTFSYGEWFHCHELAPIFEIRPFENVHLAIKLTLSLPLFFICNSGTSYVLTTSSESKQTVEL